MCVSAASLHAAVKGACLLSRPFKEGDCITWEMIGSCDVQRSVFASDLRIEERPRKPANKITTDRPGVSKHPRDGALPWNGHAGVGTVPNIPTTDTLIRNLMSK